MDCKLLIAEIALLSGETIMTGENSSLIALIKTRYFEKTTDKGNKNEDRRGNKKAIR